MFSPENPQNNRSPLDQFTRALEVGLAIFLSLVVIAVLAGAILIILNMDRGSASQGGRYYVAIGALVILGALDTQFGRLVKRRAPLRPWTTKQERIYAGVSLLLMLIFAGILFGLAYFMP